jgi:mono/diheme cytochrome c family protein
LAAALQKRQGPDLSQVGRRVFPGWIFSWLENPQRLRPQAVMPRLFAGDESGRVQRYAVATYLASLGGPLPSQERRPKELRDIVGRGEQSFRRAGCAVCHSGAEGHPAIADLTGLGSKTMPARLAEFLADPLSIDPSGRMPDMSLRRGEARDLAYWLCESAAEGIDRELPEPPAAESVIAAFEHLQPAAEQRKEFTELEPAERLLALGRSLVTAKGCTNCHRIAPAGEPRPPADAAPAFAVLRDPQRQQRGCLRSSDTPHGDKNVKMPAPRFALTAGDRDALRTFLVQASRGPGTPAPTFAASVTLERFHCLACHERNGSGGLAPEQVDALRKVETAQETEQLTPPSLTEVGRKLQTPWLRAMLTERRRARPWMPLRMPQFGRENVGHLAEALAACDGVDPGAETKQFEYDPDAIKVGQFLVGKTAFGCIGCHDIAGRPSNGTRGPDLASMRDRVRYDWYVRWLYDAQRMQPGTRMPTVFPDGRSPLETLLGGTGAAQAGAIWQYLALGENLPLPDGVESHEALALAPKDRVLVVRTFMPDAGNRALAVGFPDGVSFAFDAAQCRLAYGWTGGFLDAAPIWNARGGRPAGLLGPRFWTAPPEFPWAVTTSAEGDVPPDWSKRANDAALGAPVPEGTLPEEPPRIHFHGYRLDHSGAPTFRYALTRPSGEIVEVQERVEPRQELAGVGLLRHFDIAMASNQTAWHLVGSSEKPIRILDAQGHRLESPPDSYEIAAADAHLLLPRGDGPPLLVSLVSGPKTARWVLHRDTKRWYSTLWLGGMEPEGTESTKERGLRATIAVWSPYRDEPAMIRDLIGKGTP